MPSPIQKEANLKLKKEREMLRQSYQAVYDSLAMADLLKKLDDEYTLNHSLALKEIDNPTRSVSLLQRANAYDIVRTYIRDLSC